MSVAERVGDVRQRLAKAASDAGRSPEDVTLVAVCKRQPIDRILEVHDEGVRDFGESTVQGLCDTAEELQKHGRQVRWHFVGRLQRNKVNRLLPYGALIQTVDREELAEALSQRAPKEGIDVLVQVNIGEEEQKGGVPKKDAVAFARSVAQRPGLRLKGLMGMPPYGVDPRPYYQELAALGRELQDTPEGRDAAALSMGMSDDFETAIECGSTHVRVGTALFGERMAR